MASSMSSSMADSTVVPGRSYPKTRPIVSSESDPQKSAGATADAVANADHTHHVNHVEHPSNRGSNTASHSGVTSHGVPNHGHLESTATPSRGMAWHDVHPNDDDGIVAVISDERALPSEPVRSTAPRVRQWVREPIRAPSPSRTRPPPPVHESRSLTQEATYWQVACGMHSGYGRPASPTNLEQHLSHPSTQAASSTPSRQERSAVVMDVMSSWNGRSSASRTQESCQGHLASPSNATSRALGVALGVFSGSKQRPTPKEPSNTQSPTPDRQRFATPDARLVSLAEDDDRDSCLSPAPSPIYYAPTATPRQHQQHAVLHYDRRSLPSNRGAVWCVPEAVHNDHRCGAL